MVLSTITYMPFDWSHSDTTNVGLCSTYLHISTFCKRAIRCSQYSKLSIFISLYFVYMSRPGYAALMFQQVGPLAEEHWLNSLSAWVTGSKYCHVELIFGDDEEGYFWSLQVYNGEPVRFFRRKGLNPALVYVGVPCTKQQESKMKEFAQWAAGQKGNKALRFSKLAMFRAGIGIPRRTPNIPQNVFCAELVARALQIGQKISMDSNPGAATPQVLWNMFSKSGALTGNPVVLNQIMQSQNRQTKPPKEWTDSRNLIGCSMTNKRNAYQTQERQPLTQPISTHSQASSGFFSQNYEMQSALQQATMKKPTLRMLSQCNSV